MGLGHIGALPEGYVSSSLSATEKILLAAMIVFFAVVFFIFVIQFYLRWLAERSHDNASLPRFMNFVYSGETHDPSPATGAALCNSGLDESVIQSLPIFVFVADAQEDNLECTICLSALQDKEAGRLLPECHHGFHVACIDMWFQSHSTCPICRNLVKRWQSPSNVTAINGGDCAVSEIPPVDVTSSAIVASDPDFPSDATLAEFASEKQSSPQSLEFSERPPSKSPSENPLMKLKRMLGREKRRCSSSLAFDESDVEAGGGGVHSSPRREEQEPDLAEVWCKN